MTQRSIFLLCSLLLCAGVSAQQGTVHFVTEIGGQYSHEYELDGFGVGGPNKSGSGTLDGSTQVTWSTDNAGHLTIKVNGVEVAALADGGSTESGSGTEGGGTIVTWTNIDFAQPE